MPLHDLLADGQAEPGARILLPRVQAMEDLEHARCAARMPIPSSEMEMSQASSAFRADTAMRGPRVPELDRIREQVLEELEGAGGLPPPRREAHHLQPGPALVQRRFEVGARLATTSASATRAVTGASQSTRA